MSLRRPPNTARSVPSEARIQGLGSEGRVGGQGRMSQVRADSARPRRPLPGAAGLVRDRLLAALDPLAESPLALVIAGPGHGKTTLPRFNLSRLELGGAPFLDESALRFRWWEVDRLFTEVYGDPLHPEDVLPLTRLTGGRAAFLHMLHLGTRGRPLAERRRALARE